MRHPPINRFTVQSFKETAPVRGWLAPGPFPLLGRLIETQRQDAGKSRQLRSVAPHGSHAS